MKYLLAIKSNKAAPRWEEFTYHVEIPGADLVWGAKNGQAFQHLLCKLVASDYTVLLCGADSATTITENGVEGKSCIDLNELRRQLAADIRFPVPLLGEITPDSRFMVVSGGGRPITTTIGNRCMTAREIAREMGCQVSQVMGSLLDNVYDENLAYCGEKT